MIATLPAFPTMARSDIDKVRQVESMVRQLDQVQIETQHTIHAGMYARTIRIPAGVVLTGVLIKRATLLILSGNATVYVGGREITFTGYHVLPASAGRKQLFYAHQDTRLTMLFPTSATTVDQAETEFTDEIDSLMSRHTAGHDLVQITGE